MVSDLVCKRSRRHYSYVGSGISPFALTEKGMVSRAVTKVGSGGDPEWPETYRSPTNSLLHHSIRRSYLDMCLIITLYIALYPHLHLTLLNYYPVRRSEPLESKLSQPFSFYIYIYLLGKKSTRAPPDIFSSNLVLSAKCSSRNDDSVVLCYTPDFRIESFAD